MTGLVLSAPATDTSSTVASQVRTWDGSGQTSGSGPSSGQTQPADDDSGSEYPQASPPGNAAGTSNQPAATGNNSPGTSTTTTRTTDLASAVNQALAYSLNYYAVTPWYVSSGLAQSFILSVTAADAGRPSVGICVSDANETTQPYRSAETTVAASGQREIAIQVTGGRQEKLLVSSAVAPHASSTLARVDTDNRLAPEGESSGEAEQDDLAELKPNRPESSSSISQTLLDSSDWVPRVTDALVGMLPSPLDSLEARVDSFFSSLTQLGDEANPASGSSLAEWLLLTAIAGGACECTRRLLYKGGPSRPWSEIGRPPRRTPLFDPRFDDE